MYFSVSTGGPHAYVAQQVAQQLASAHAERAEEAVISTRIASAFAEFLATLPPSVRVSISFSGSIGWSVVQPENDTEAAREPLESRT